MKIVCIGGGPAGLYFSILMKLQDRGHQITVLERLAEHASPGLGIVFSSQTLSNLEAADAQSSAQIRQALHHWDAISIHSKAQTEISNGHAFAAIGRQTLRSILHQRCRDLGVQLVFNCQVEDSLALAKSYQADLLIASDGVHSQLRQQMIRNFPEAFQVQAQLGACRYIWLGTRQNFDSFCFDFESTEYGVFQAHAYQYEADRSTFIIETSQQTWCNAGLDQMDLAQTLSFFQQVFAAYLNGHSLYPEHHSDLSEAEQTESLKGLQKGLQKANWQQFKRIHAQKLVHYVSDIAQSAALCPVVLIGDAAHTAHFSIGSGTKLAMEDAIALATQLSQSSDADGLRTDNQQANSGLVFALEQYQQQRTVEFLKLQSAARNSMQWFEQVEQYLDLPAFQFAYSLLTRSQRLSHENLNQRDPDYITKLEETFARQAFQSAALPSQVLAMPTHRVAPMFTPYRLRTVLLKNRIVVSPMAQYCAKDGVVGNFHLMHLGSRAIGGAALVMTEMTAVSAHARITPGCPGIYTDPQTEAWRQIVDFVHQQSDAKIAIQLGHSGAKGATKVAWEGINLPLAESESEFNVETKASTDWPLVSASVQQYLPGVSKFSSAATEAEMNEILEDFVLAAKNAERAGFDWLELHCAHGYLLSSFLSPLTNQRSDAYGGTLENRCRFPLQVFAAIRAVWPDEKPISVRISAHDWVDGGNTPEDAVKIAAWFKAAGADMLACSSGQVSPDERVVYGRMYQTPFSDKIRNRMQIPTIAVGAITDGDQVNTIIASGRADLCAIGRPHLANPAWTLHQAANMGYSQMNWPLQYQSAKTQCEKLYRESGSA